MEKTELIQQTKTWKPDKLILVEYKNTYQIFTPEQLTEDPGKINEIAKRDGPIVSVKEIRPLKDQKRELEDLQFELEQSVKTLETLVEDLCNNKDSNSKEYNESLWRAASYVSDNIIKKAQSKLDVIFQLLEHNDVG